MKDNFSTQSDQYLKYRPTYPTALFDYINSLVANKNAAWDCGTGNGQVAFELAKTFDQVFATDISEKQLAQAKQGNNINYTLQPAEHTNFKDQQFDLVTVAQAIHWFDFEQFYKEIKRVAKPNALIAVIGYGKLEIGEEIDTIIANFYENIIGTYWDAERKYIDEGYKTIPFPFEEIETPKFAIEMSLNLEQLIGYLNTWSAVKHFITKNGFNPIENLKSEIEQYWKKDKIMEIKFPLLLRIGIIT